MKRRILLLVAMVVSYFVLVASFSTSEEKGIIAKILRLLGLKSQTTSRVYYGPPTLFKGTTTDSTFSNGTDTDPIPPPPFPPDTT